MQASAVPKVPGAAKQPAKAPNWLRDKPGAPAAVSREKLESLPAVILPAASPTVLFVDASITILCHGKRYAWNAHIPKGATYDQATQLIQGFLALKDEVSIELYDIKHDDWVELKDAASLRDNAKLRVTALSMLRPRKDYDVYLSYKLSNGLDLARLVKLELEMRCPGVKVFLDTDELPELSKLLLLEPIVKSARNFVLVLTPGALQRPYVQRETSAALRFKKNVVVVHDEVQGLPPSRELPKNCQAVLQSLSIGFSRSRSAWETFIKRLVLACGLFDPSARDRIKSLVAATPNKKMSIAELRASLAAAEDKAKSRPQRATRQCSACTQDIVRGVLEADGRYFHKECFLCSACRKPCADAYFARDDKFVCAECNVGLCPRCSQTITDMAAAFTAAGATYHAACFACKRCAAALSDCVYFEDDRGDVVCAGCRDITNCYKCGKVIGSEPSLDVNGHEYHLNCFRCESCGVLLMDVFVERDERNYCSEGCTRTMQLAEM